jgi:hypothetical protein
MAWDLEFTDEFGAWFERLSESEQESVARTVKLPKAVGPGLGHPHAESLSKQLKHSNLKELRVAHRGDAYRIFSTFDPRHIAILLCGGRKPDQKWYKEMIPVADKLCEQHLKNLKAPCLVE